MAELSKDEKRALMKKWKAAQKKKYILGKTKVKKLFRYLDTTLQSESCSHTLRYTEQWLKANMPPDQIENVLAEMTEMGGHCDCEVLLNCYEIYDIE